MRLKEHPILDKKTKQQKVTISVDGRKISALLAEPVAAALIASGLKTLRVTKKFHSPRGIFCAVGKCTDCMMTVNNKKNVRICTEKVTPNMQIFTQIYEENKKSK